MKKPIWLGGLLVLCLLGGGCMKAEEEQKSAPLEPSAVQPLQKAEMAMEMDTVSYPLDVEQLTVTITNHTDAEISYGTYYSIEIFQNDQWHAIPFAEDFGFNDIAILLAPGKAQKESIDLQASDFVFTEGRYRLVKELGGQVYSAEFELIKET